MVTENRATMAATPSSSSSTVERGPCHEACCVDGCESDSVPPRNSQTSCLQIQSEYSRLPTEQDCATMNDDNYRARYRRRRSVDWQSSAFIVVVARTAVIANSLTTTDAFAPVSQRQRGPCSPMAPSLQSSMALNAVHKRSGNHDLSHTSAAISASRSQATKKVSASKRKATVANATATPTMESAVTAPVRRSHTGRKKNVFEQFTPDYISSPYDVDLSPAEGEILSSKTTAAAATKRVNMSQIRKNNKINLRLQSLLKDDTGEQEMEMFPDHSPEAAEQLAELKSYNKMNEEARRKANIAVKSDGEDEDEGIVVSEGGTLGKNKARKPIFTAKERRGEQDEGEEQATANMVTLTPSNKRVVASPRTRGRIRATVKETGADSMSTYIKSLGQHELLSKEDEVLLGRQVRLLTGLEASRQELEEDLLQPPTFAQWAASTNHTVPSLKQQIRRSQRAKAALIEANLRLVITVARTAVKKSPLRQSQSANSVQFQDACQQGIIGLTRATEKFDPELGFRFSTYAIWWIQKEVAKNVSEQSRSVRVPPSAIKKINDIRIQERILMSELGHKPNDEELAERVGISVEKLQFYRQSAKEVGSLDKQIDARKGKGSMSTGGDSGGGQTMDIFVKDTEAPSPSELIDQEMMKEDIRRLVRTLSPREQAVIRLRFGLDDGKPLGLADISAKFGVEKAKIKKIEARALLKMREPSRSQVVKCYVSDLT